MRAIENLRNTVEYANPAEAVDAAHLHGPEPITYLPAINMEPASFDNATVALTQWVTERFDDLDPTELALFLVFGCTWKHDSH